MIYKNAQDYRNNKEISLCKLFLCCKSSLEFNFNEFYYKKSEKWKLKERLYIYDAVKKQPAITLNCYIRELSIVPES